MIKRKSNSNKKVRNATPCQFDNIQFKSLLERNCYIELKRANLIVQYEPIKFLLQKGERVLKPYLYFKKGIQVIETNKKLIDTTWTPDFIITNNNGHKFIFESKGKLNDIFPIKFKMFRHLMEDMEYYGILLITCKRDCIEAIKWIKNN